MATLQNIRNKGPLLVIVVGVALLAFILGDLLTSGSTFIGQARDRAFVVDGKVVTTQQYADKITEFEEFQKMISGQTSLDETTSLQIREAVYQQMVRDQLLSNQSDKLGLTVTKAEMNDLVHGQSISPILQQLPFFVNPETGLYSRPALMEFLNVINTASPSPQEQALVDQYRSLWLFIENMIKTQRLEEKYVSLLSNAVMVNDLEAETSFSLSQQNANIAYVMQSYFTVPDSAVTVTDKEIKDFYNKNKHNYKIEAPLVKISYFTKEIVPSDEDIAEIEQEAQTAFAMLRDTDNPATVVSDYSQSPYRDIYMAANMLTPSQLDFARTASAGDVKSPTREGDAFQMYRLIDKTTAPDSVHLSMLAIPDATMAGQDSIVTNFVDSIYNEIRDGNSFAEVADALNPSSNGGDVGWAREIDLLPFGKDFVEAAFNASVGEPMRLSVQGQQVIFQVEERSRPVEKFKLAVINMPVLASEKTSNNIDNELNQFITAEDIGPRFNELASEEGYMVMPNMTYSANDFSLGQIPASRQIITWAANEKKMGTVRKFDLTNLRVVARVDEVIKSGTTPLSEVSESIRMQLLNEKKAEKLIADLEQQNLTSLEAYAEAMNSRIDTLNFVNFATQNITGLGFEPAINAASSFAPLNTVTGPMEGNMGVYAVSVLNRSEGSATYDATEQKEMIMNDNAYRLQMQAVEVLKNELGVEDNRYRFF